MRLREKIFGLLSVCAMTISSGSAFANIIYTVDLPATGDLTLQGTITTDGNSGTLTRADVLDWDLTVSSASLTAGYEFLGPLNSTLRLDSAVATTTTLFLPYPSVFDLEGSGPPCNVSCGQAVVTPVPPGGNVEYFRTCNAAGACDEVEMGLPFGIQLADAGVAATPLPAALPLFATGLGGLGLLGWRKRKAQTNGRNESTHVARAY